MITRITDYEEMSGELYRLLVLLYLLFTNFADTKPVVGLSAMVRVTK